MSAETCDCQLTATETGTALKLAGAWRLATLATAWAELNRLRLKAPLAIDGSALQSLDAAAALALLRALAAAGIDPHAITLNGFSESHRRIFDDVRHRLAATAAPVPRARSRWLTELGRKTA